MQEIVKSLLLLLVVRSVRGELFANDGVLIKEEGATRAIQAIWTALVVVNSPRAAPIDKWILRVQDSITIIKLFVSREDRQVWTARLHGFAFPAGMLVWIGSLSVLIFNEPLL